ncbi:phosphonate ABC transporter, permease protein PhnE [Leptothoe sp. PORK10 BA2]|uniref:phosphonate ABC transporter, permease protein PhnE n=1 Tax=Leptothoe sp. PORK10 BA2 TaxID=3110254 RepID=UPI002B206964|nr:phosphonate ABC transporter, permease protein PhnE [Leptothoe sp. PORK10 BA2]MEA5465811.1 phosphonate ABC transporter, permease protein PhnE [Leptothoe sp. PORK10 BA2]
MPKSTVDLSYAPTDSLNESVSPEVRDLLAQEKPVMTPLRIFSGVVAIAILIYAGQKSDLSFVELIQGSGNMAEYISRYFPPDFTDWKFYLSDILETIGMGLWGTLMAAIVAVPLSIVAAENVAPVWLVFITRRFLDGMRAINEVVFALIFVVAVGLGPFAGVLALFVHTAGTLAKLFSEAIEAIEPGPVEGIRSTGASKLQEVIFGVIPQVIPLWTSFTLYRFEANVRAASVLGIVGAGGIGVSLYQSFRSFQYGKVAAILIILIVSVSIIDTVSAKIRQRLV